SELKRRLAAMDQYCEDLPAPELLMSLVPAEDAPTVEEFLDIFDAPVTVELDSEKVTRLAPCCKHHEDHGATKDSNG
ncbi:uncharacterized protein HaLaN_21944, partial [Haematococcus lacustris]